MTGNSACTRRSVVATVGSTVLLSGGTAQSKFTGQHTKESESIACNSWRGTWFTATGNTQGTHVAGEGATLPKSDAQSSKIAIEQAKKDTNSVASYPAIANETIFATLTSGRAFAHGEQNWITELESEGTGTPTVTCDAVYLTDDAYTYSLDYSNGKRIWKADEASLTSPVITGDRVIVGGFGSISAFDKRSGEQLWRQFYPHSETTYGIASAGGFVVTTTKSTEEGYIHCYTTEGTHQWSQKVGPLFSTPAISNEKVFVGDHTGDIHALRLSSGEYVWENRVGREIETGFAVKDGTVFVPGGADGNVHAVDSATGDIKWKTPIGISPTGPALVDDQLAVTGDDIDELQSEDSDVGIAILDCKTGDVNKTFDTPGASNSLVDARGALAVGVESLYYKFNSSIYSIK